MAITPREALELAKKKEGNEEEVISFWVDKMGREIDNCLITYAKNPEISFGLSGLEQCLEFPIYEKVIEGLIAWYNCNSWQVKTRRSQGGLWLVFNR